MPWTKFIKHEPTSKQFSCLLLGRQKEVFYGGAAAGGKTDWMAMEVLQYVDIPRYSAIIFRRTMQDAFQAGAIGYRLDEWLQPWYRTGEVYWDNQHSRFTFPRSGATIQIGYSPFQFASNRYSSSEYQFVGFDELTHFWKEDYEQMVTRCRRRSCSIHLLDDTGEPIFVRGCPECAIAQAVPLRIRSASNPPRAGEPGLNGWIHDRFQIKKVPTRIDGKVVDIFRGTHPKRLYVPAFLKDNPFVDQKSYEESLKDVDPVMRDRLLYGDWSAAAEGRFRRTWVQYYEISNYTAIRVHRKDGRADIFDLRDCIKFQTCDPAATIAEGPGDKDIWKRAPSRTAISTWYLTPKYDLIWWDCEAFFAEVPEVILRCKQSIAFHRPQFTAVEAAGPALGVYQALVRAGLTIRAMKPGISDKLERATPMLIRMEAGQVFFPNDRFGGAANRTESWMDDADREVFGWTGHKTERADIIDTMAYAGILANELSQSFEAKGRSLPMHSR